MKNRTIAAALTIALALPALSACASLSEGATPVVATPTVEPVDPNKAACAQFESIFLDIGDVLHEDATSDEWDAYGEEYDFAALEAEGDVKERLLALVEEWPEFSDIIVLGQFELLDDVTMPVARACEAAGYPTEVFATADL